MVVAQLEAADLLLGWTSHQPPMNCSRHPDTGMAAERLESAEPAGAGPGPAQLHGPSGAQLQCPPSAVQTLTAAYLQNGWNLLSLLVLVLDLLRLAHWAFYAERAVRMLSSLRALRIVVLSPAMQALLGALAKSTKAILALALLSTAPCSVDAVGWYLAVLVLVSALHLESKGAS